MRASSELFGTYQPAGSPLERVPVGWKYAILLVLTVPAIVVGSWWFSLASILVTLAILLGARVGTRRATTLGWGMAVVGVLIVVVQAL
ncbi:MAG TPA: hypothetical protein VLS51_01605, partial [Propionibacteriaceae bacterium]|nr:hypothetical protein [Propionibacteriaceae bacterium]